MSMPDLLLDGARRAAAYATMLFSLNGPPAPSPAPAAAVPPACAPAASSLAVDASVSGSGLTLVAHHLDVRIADGVASVQTMMLLRNDRPTDLAVQYLLPQAARVRRADFDRIGPAAACAPRDETDLSLQEAERAETATGRPVQRHDVIVVAPGEQISLEVHRDQPIGVAGGVHRLLLPLPVDREAPWVPRFTADVIVEAEQRIARLSSPTHPALVDGLGERTALLSVPDGFVYRQAELRVEFELDAGGEAVPNPGQSK